MDAPSVSEESPAALNESPSEKEGKYNRLDPLANLVAALNESPSEKEGKCPAFSQVAGCATPQ